MVVYFISRKIVLICVKFVCIGEFVPDDILHFQRNHVLRLANKYDAIDKITNNISLF